MTPGSQMTTVAGQEYAQFQSFFFGSRCAHG
jgi:hypothetical protein